MPTDAKKASAFAACTALLPLDSVVTLTTGTVPNNAITTLAHFFANIQCNVSVSNAASLIVSGSNTPANSIALASVVKGTIWFDSNFIYVATANGIVKSAALSSF